MNSARRRPVSLSCFCRDSSTLMRFSCQPVSSDARRTFWPLRPIAIARFSSSTTTSIACFSSSTRMLCTSAGASALMTNLAGSSENRMMSTRSPASSLVTAVTREPRMPMHVPCGSSRGSFDLTAIFARMPGSRAAALISIRPSSISGTSSSNSRTRNSGAMRDRMSCGPLAVRSIFITYARMRSPTRSISFWISWSRGITPSMRPDSTMMLPRSIRLTVPVKRLSSRSRKSLRICSRSASRIFCRITCFAACAPMRPNSIGSSGSSTTSPSLSSGSRSAASVIAIWCAGSSCSSSGTTVQRRKES